MAELSLSEFADRLQEIMPVIARSFMRRQEDELSSGKITIPQFFILHFLNKESQAKMSELASFMNVTTAAMTGIIDRLVRCGYIVRVFDPQDRRIIKIKLTPAGQGLVKKINKHRQQAIMDTFSQISQREREDYLRILGRIRGILEEKQIRK